MENRDSSYEQDKSISKFSKACALAAGVELPVGVFLTLLSGDSSLGGVFITSGLATAAIGAANVHYDKGNKHRQS
jgi:hypothetical protein